MFTFEALLLKKNKMNLDQQTWWSNYINDEKGVLLDVRTADEFSMNRIPNALNIDIYKGNGFIEQVEKLDTNKNYYVYCHAGVRSANAIGVMMQLGFENPFNLVGGIGAFEGPIE